MTFTHRMGPCPRRTMWCSYCCWWLLGEYHRYLVASGWKCRIWSKFVKTDVCGLLHGLGQTHKWWPKKRKRIFGSDEPWWIDDGSLSLQLLRAAQRQLEALSLSQPRLRMVQVHIALVSFPTVAWCVEERVTNVHTISFSTSVISISECPIFAQPGLPLVPPLDLVSFSGYIARAPMVLPKNWMNRVDRRFGAATWWIGERQVNYPMVRVF